MAALRIPEDAPEPFVRALHQLHQARLRPEVMLTEVPAPVRAAPYGAAWTAEVIEGDDVLAVGRFVLLYDPSGPDAWEGTFRAVTFARGELEPEIGADPLLGGVGWSWLEESLALHDARAIAHGGTVTSTVSEGFGTLEGPSPVVELEVRSSWTPIGDVGPHLQAWATLLCTVAGLPQVPEGVAALPRRR